MTLMQLTIMQCSNTYNICRKGNEYITFQGFEARGTPISARLKAVMMKIEILMAVIFIIKLSKNDSG